MPSYCQVPHTITNGKDHHSQINVFKTLFQLQVFNFHWKTNKSPCDIYVRMTHGLYNKNLKSLVDIHTSRLPQSRQTNYTGWISKKTYNQ